MNVETAMLVSAIFGAGYFAGALASGPFWNYMHHRALLKHTERMHRLTHGDHR